MATVERHQDISADFLKQAYIEQENGDLLQASEKAWGAVSHYVKSIAERQGWRHSTHADIFTNTRQVLGPSYERSGARRMLMVVNALHRNFYEDELSDVEVRAGIDDAKTLIEILKPW